MHQHILIWRRSVPHALGANFNTGVPRIFITFANILRLKKQGQIHGTLVACGWSEAVLKKVTRAFGQEQ